MKVQFKAIAFAVAALTLGQAGWAGEAEAKKWIDSEFQPSTLNKGKSNPAPGRPGVERGSVQGAANNQETVMKVMRYSAIALAAAGVLTIVPGAIVIWFVRHYIAKGFAMGRV